MFGGCSLTDCYIHKRNLLSSTKDGQPEERPSPEDSGPAPRRRRRPEPCRPAPSCPPSANCPRGLARAGSTEGRGSAHRFSGSDTPGSPAVLETGPGTAGRGVVPGGTRSRGMAGGARCTRAAPSTPLTPPHGPPGAGLDAVGPTHHRNQPIGAERGKSEAEQSGRGRPRRSAGQPHLLFQCPQGPPAQNGPGLGWHIRRIKDL